MLRRSGRVLAASGVDFGALLADDLLVEVARMLDSATDLTRLLQVCHPWRRAILRHSDGLWKTLARSRWPEMVNALQRTVTPAQPLSYHRLYASLLCSRLEPPEDNVQLAPEHSLADYRLSLQLKCSGQTASWHGAPEFCTGEDGMAHLRCSLSTSVCCSGFDVELALFAHSPRSSERVEVVRCGGATGTRWHDDDLCNLFAEDLDDEYDYSRLDELVDHCDWVDAMLTPHFHHAELELSQSSGTCVDVYFELRDSEEDGRRRRFNSMGADEFLTYLDHLAPWPSCCAAQKSSLSWGIADYVFSIDIFSAEHPRSEAATWVGSGTQLLGKDAPLYILDTPTWLVSAEQLCLEIHVTRRRDLSTCCILSASTVDLRSLDVFTEFSGVLSSVSAREFLQPTRDIMLECTLEAFAKDHAAKLEVNLRIIPFANYKVGEDAFSSEAVDRQQLLGYLMQLVPW